LLLLATTAWGQEESGGSSSIALGLGVTVDSAVTDGSVGEVFTGAGNHTWPFHRGDIIVGGDVSKIVATQAQQQSPLTFSVNAAGVYKVSPRATLRIGEKVTDGYARQLTDDMLADERTLYPTVLTRFNSLATGFTYELSPLSLLQVEGQYETIHFRGASGEDVTTAATETTLLQRSSSYLAAVSFHHRLTRTNSLGIDHVSSRGTFGAGDSSTTHGFRLLWDGSVGRDFAISAGIGPVAYFVPFLNGFHYATIGRLILSRHGDEGSFTIGYERLIDVLGNAHLSNLVKTSYSRSFTKLTIGTSGTYATNSYPGDPRFRNEGIVAELSGEYKLGAALTVVANYTYWRRSPTGSAGFDLTNYATGVSLLYGHTWR